VSIRCLRAMVVGAGLSGLLAVLSATPAAAAELAPGGWEADALGLSAAHRVSQGEGVTVAVLDSGVVAEHPAVKGRVTTGPDFRKDGLASSSPDWGLMAPAWHRTCSRSPPRHRSFRSE
jgi:subtilisin family serine protease